MASLLILLLIFYRLLPSLSLASNPSPVINCHPVRTWESKWMRNFLSLQHCHEINRFGLCHNENYMKYLGIFLMLQNRRMSEILFFPSLQHCKETQARHVIWWDVYPCCWVKIVTIVHMAAIRHWNSQSWPPPINATPNWLRNWMQSQVAYFKDQTWKL